MKIEFAIPKSVSQVTDTLKKANFKAFLVGGCVRDLVLGRAPKDWDITTDAKPEDIVSLFPKTFYENSFGTVTVVDEEEEDVSLKNVEVTPFRKEIGYSDKRHPDTVEFGVSLEEDLARRDFTINALAYDPSVSAIFDLYEGIKDLKDSVVRTVGDASLRFNEDPLRLLRAIRFATQLGFTIEEKTERSIMDNAEQIKFISNERIRDELLKIISSDEPMKGLGVMQKLGLLRYILPEMEGGVGMEQNGDHIYTVWEHIIRAIQHAADKKMSLEIRLAALFHDIGKIKTRARDNEKGGWTFYGHEVVSERLADKIMERWHLSNKVIDTVTKLVRNHMFFSDVDQITLSAVRRVIVKVGPDLIWDLMRLRNCDRIGMGRPKESPYRLRKYESMIDEALRAPTSVGMLKINGAELMQVTGETPGPKVGHILNALLEEALEDPSLNTKEYLDKRALELSKLSEKELILLSEKGKQKKNEVEQKELEAIRKKHFVK